MQQFKVYQSMWAMERRRPDGAEWSLQEKLNLIIDGGFDGVGLRFVDRAYVAEVTQRLRDAGLSWQAQCYPRAVDDLKPVLDLVAEFGCDHVNLQADVRPHSVVACVPLIEGWQRLAAEAGVALNLETHRDRMTTDLHFTLQLLDRFPELRLTGDLSHYLVGREFAWPVSDENHALMHRVMDHCWAYHGRVANREQIQAHAAPLTLHAGDSVTFDFDFSGLSPAAPYDLVAYGTLWSSSLPRPSVVGTVTRPDTHGPEPGSAALLLVALAAALASARRVTTTSPRSSA